MYAANGNIRGEKPQIHRGADDWGVEVLSIERLVGAESGVALVPKARMREVAQKLKHGKTIGRKITMESMVPEAEGDKGVKSRVQ